MHKYMTGALERELISKGLWVNCKGYTINITSMDVNYLFNVVRLLFYNIFDEEQIIGRNRSFRKLDPSFYSETYKLNMFVKCLMRLKTKVLDKRESLRSSEDLRELLEILSVFVSRCKYSTEEGLPEDMLVNDKYNNEEESFSI